MIMYRQIEKSDYDALAMIIAKTWGNEATSEYPKVARHFGNAYLLSCLMGHDYTLVAVSDDKPIGVIIGADCSKKSYNIKYRLQSIPHYVYLGLNRKFRKSLKQFGDYVSAMEELEQEVDIEFQSEIRLFIIDSEYRGMGIGSHLYHRLMEHFQDRGVSTFYLHTDTACNYRFYDHKGLRLLSQKNTKYSCAGVKNIKLFLYGKTNSSQKNWQPSCTSNNLRD